ncbi:MAG TPA: prepilin-type N-terminal cleavage/methylation domain-containing protein [Patescibacteria group bacterium]|nr:prepilin-type N-terminal cleavage/methylation domain-containing protein [Patescibacteria group bacterium]
MKKQSGMTLIELVIVVTIIAALAVIALAFYRNQSAKSLDAKRKADLARIQVAVEEYEKDHNCYPAPQLLNCNPGTGLQPYIDRIPCDPITKASYYYDYDANACASWYRIYANLNDKSGTPIGPNGAFNYYASSPNAPEASLTQVGNLFGCKGGFCVQVLWNSLRPGPECDPTFKSSTCYGQCGVQSAQCVTWEP